MMKETKTTGSRLLLSRELQQVHWTHQRTWMTICRPQRGDIHSARARGPFNKCQGSTKRTTEGRKMHSRLGVCGVENRLFRGRQRNSLYFSVIATYFENLFIYLFWLLGLCCCVQASSSCGEWELLLVGVHGLPGGWAVTDGFFCWEHGPSGTRASVAVAHRL